MTGDGVARISEDQAPGARWAALVGRADAVAVEAAGRPLPNLVGLLVLNLVLCACFAAAGIAIGDPAGPFRELAPGTWLSFAQLLAVVVVARAVHVRVGAGRWYQDLWGLAAVAFAVFAVDEITQAGMFLSEGLGALGLEPAAGFNDLDAVLLSLLFATVALVLLPRAWVLVRHPRALGVLVVAVLLGAASQGLDSFVPATQAEFVAEETLKLASEVFFVGGFLVALRDVLRDRPAPPQPPPS